jgi:phosphatidylinositol alpha-1,6-mannosyltransferase
MNVLIVTPVYPPPPGGIQTLVRNLEDGLELIDQSSTVLDINPKSLSTYRASDFIPRIRTSEIFNSNSLYLFPYFNAVYRKVSKAIKKYDPDIVHAIHIRGWPALKAGNDQNVPTVVSAHAAELVEQRVASIAFDQADTVHAVSKFTKEVIKRDHGISGIEIIPPSIDVGYFSRGRTNQSKQSSDVFSISRLVKRKNIITLVKAWKMLDGSIRNNRRLRIAGDGPQFDSISNEINTSNDIEMLGWISEDQKRNQLQNSALFVLPASGKSYDVEGFGIVYLEAQASGTPVIGSMKGGAPEAIGKAGITLRDECDPVELAESLNSILTEDEKYNKYLKNADKRIIEFDLTQIARQYVKVYSSLL